MMSALEQEIIAKFEQLDDDAKERVRAYLRAFQTTPVKEVRKEQPNELTPRKPRKAGSAKGQIIIHPDFDDPLDDFDKHSK
jgi:hypothetical protein